MKIGRLDGQLTILTIERQNTMSVEHGELDRKSVV